MEDEPNYTYYIIQIGEQYLGNRDCECTLTGDAEQACVFTTFDTAVFQAKLVNGDVQKKIVYETELQVLTEHHYAEYKELPLAEREKIAMFCQQLIEET